MDSPDCIPSVCLAHYTRGDAGARRAFAASLRAGFEEFGFVTVVEHGVAPELVAEVYASCSEFFALGEQEKARSGGSSGGARGFTAFGIEHAKDASAADLKEFFHIGRELARSPSELQSEFESQSDSLANRWPEAVPSLAHCGPRLFSALEECSAVLLAALATAYELSEAVFADMVRDGNHVLRALHYPPIRADVPAGSLRAAPHEDINLITLLCEASTSGLEIRRPGGRGDWMAVRAGPGEIVADAGDMLARITNGVIRAATHRVVSSPEETGRHRYSLPFFAHPRPECDLSVLDAFQSPEHPPRTPPITAGEFLQQRLKEIGLA